MTSQQIIQLVQKSKKILIMPSSPPDGDSIGSALALFLAFKKLDKEVTVVCADPIPDVYSFLPSHNVIDNQLVTSNDLIVTLDCSKAKIDTIKTNLEENKVNIIITPKKGLLSEKEVSYNYGPSKYDLIIVVDAGDLQQLGKLYEDNAGLFTQIPVINIDHHVSNNQFGKINHVDIMASSTTEMLIPIVEELGKAEGKDLMDDDIATLLLAGIITDTGSFQNANTSPNAFELAGHLLGYGARQQEIIQHIYKTKNLTMLKLWGRVLTKIQYDNLYRLVWSTISQRDLQETSSKAEETGDIIDELMTNAPGADVILLIKEREEGVVSCSIRTTNDAIDASLIAEEFNGGGHARAAGFKIESANLAETEEKIIAKVREYQAKRLNIHPDEEPQVVSGLEMDSMKKLQDVVWEGHKQAVVKGENEVEKMKDKVKKPKAEVNKASKPSRVKEIKEKKSKKKPEVVENIPKDQDEVDLQPGHAYKFEQK